MLLVREPRIKQREYRPRLILWRILSLVVRARDQVKIRRISRSKGRCGLREEPEGEARGWMTRSRTPDCGFPRGLDGREERLLVRSSVSPFLLALCLCLRIHAYCREQRKERVIKKLKRKGGKRERERKKEKGVSG